MSNPPNRWQPGHSGNPRGRPPGRRALSVLLRLNSDQPVTLDGQQLTAREALARRVWQLVIHGRVDLEGRSFEIKSLSEWLSCVRWLYSQIDGPA